MDESDRVDRLERSEEMLFSYLQKLFYDPANATLQVDELDEKCQKLGMGLLYFGQCLAETREFARTLSKGDLKAPLPSPENELAAPLKALHATLRHLTWQSQQVAKGDYAQRIDFMGEFSEAFNTMVVQLEEQRSKLKAEVEISRQKTLALEQSNRLLANITAGIPQQLYVFNLQDRQLLYSNDAARQAAGDPRYVRALMQVLDENPTPPDHGRPIEFSVEPAEGEPRHYAVRAYSLEWDSQRARAFVVDDVSADRVYMKQLELRARQDTLTRLHNRFSGMDLLKHWLEERRAFCLVFVDLDSLKYVNDRHGHQEGDHYIVTAAHLLVDFMPGVEACRLGGDEFMVLVPGAGAEQVATQLQRLNGRLKEALAPRGKSYVGHMSVGIVEVLPGQSPGAGEVLSLADERMYEDKRRNKRQARR
ncbi:MAG: diguanylate cyclase [Clostridiales bacterium]|nr:diguanylate cyclase [Clostridiales bacterium]